MISRPSSTQTFPSRAQAFTLIELVIAMVITSLISGAVFMMLQGTMRAAANMQARELEQAKVTALREMMRKTFGALPPEAGIELTLIEGGTPLLQELTISGVPEAFPFGVRASSSEDTVLSIRPQLNEDGTQPEIPLFVFGFTREDLIPEEQAGMIVTDKGRTLLAPDDDGRYWFPLVRDVVFLEWRVYDQENEEWIEEWDDEIPSLLQLEIQIEGRGTPLRLVFPVVASSLTGS